MRAHRCVDENVNELLPIAEVNHEETVVEHSHARIGELRKSGHFVEQVYTEQYKVRTK